ncbi:MAG: cytochrome o ubiquinol oxidase subunit [Candidatus Kaiserbacteria bacterium]|nr:cytochrome o ubiquinol oxidase subunit [Candidatus Kaiserbacteria bacterium]
MENFNTLDTEYGAAHGTLSSYIVGFVLSIILTLGAYMIVVNHMFSNAVAAGVIILIAVTQQIVQLICFLHLSAKSHARWNIIAFIFTIVIILILLVGSLWVMNNLTGRTMVPMQGDGTVNVQNAL